MDEIYQLVRIRISKVHELNKILSTPNEQLKVEDIRKAKEDEKFRTEKENWILNVLKALKDYTFEQKQILCEKSLDIMKLIWPEFQLKYPLQYDEEFNRRFLDIYLKMFTEFFQPFEQTYEFRVTLRQVARPNNISMVPDMLKYLVEFSRDYFKKFMIFLSIQRNKLVGNQQQGITQSQQQNSLSNQGSQINQNNCYGNKTTARSKSSMSNTLTTDVQNNNMKLQPSKVGIVVSNDIPQTDTLIVSISPPIDQTQNNPIGARRKSISLHQKGDDVKLLGNILKQVNQDHQSSSQQMKRIELLSQQKENDISNKIATEQDSIIEMQDISASNKINSENDPQRRKSLLVKQTQQTTSSPLRLVQNKKIIPNEGATLDEKVSPRQTPMNVQHAKSPLRQRLNNQTSIIQPQPIPTQSYNPYIKKQDLSIFPSTLCISWFVSKEKEIKITRQSNVNSVIADIDYTNVQSYNEKLDKIKRVKGGIEEIKLLYIQIYEQSKQRNNYINSTVQAYNEKYKNKYPKKVKQVVEERDKEDREYFPNTISQYQIFQTYYQSQNEDMLSSIKKNEAGNFTQASAQKMFIVKSAATKNRKYNSQAVTPPPGSSSNSILNFPSGQKGSTSSGVVPNYMNQQQTSSLATPVQQTSNTLINQQSQTPYNNFYNVQNSNLIASKPKTVSYLSQVPSFTNTAQNQQTQQPQQQRTFSPQKYHKVDHTNIQNKLKIVRLTNSRCNSAIMRPKISQVATPLNSQVNRIPTNHQDEKILEKTPSSCQEIKLSSKLNEQSTVDQSQMMRQKSNSVIEVHSKKHSSDFQQTIFTGNILETHQSKKGIYLQGDDFIIKTHSVQEIDDIDDQKFKEENSVMDASFALPLLNSKQNSPRKIGDVINIQDENGQQSSFLGTRTTPMNILNDSSENIAKFELHTKSQPNGGFAEDQPHTPTNESPGYFVLSKKKRKNVKKANEQLLDHSEKTRAQSQQSQAAPSNMRELISSPILQRETLGKSQRMNSSHNHNHHHHHQQQHSFHSTNTINLFNRELDSQVQSKIHNNYQIQQQLQSKVEEEKLISKKSSGDGSHSSSSASSSISQNVASSIMNQQNNKQLSFRFQGNSNFSNIPNNNENIFAAQAQQQNKLPQINQSGSKGGISFGGGNEIKIMQSNEDESIKSRNRNYSNQPYVKKVQDYSNILINCANQNVQKEYLMGNQNSSSNTNQQNNNASNQTSQQQSNIYSNSSKISLPNSQQQIPEDYMKNYPQNLNVMTDKFKNLLLQKINKIKGDKQQKLVEQVGNNPNGIVLGGSNGIPLKVISQQQQQMQASNMLNSQQQQIVSISQSRIIQKYSNNANIANIANVNSMISSTQPSRQNNFNTQTQTNPNQENSRSRPPSNNLIDNEAKILSQISNTMPIRKSKNISFSVDNQNQLGMQINPIKVINQKGGQQMNNNTNNYNYNNNNNQQSATPDVLQQLLTQPKNSSKDIFMVSQSRQKQQQQSFSNSTKKMQNMNPQKNYSVAAAQAQTQQIIMNIQNYTNNTNQSTQLKTGQNALQNLIGQTNAAITKNNGGFNMKLLKVQGNTINNEKRTDGSDIKGMKGSYIQETTKPFSTSLVTQLQPFFQQHQIQTQK